MASESALGLPAQSSPGVKPEETPAGDEAAAQPRANQDEKKKEKKRGFWSRLFGRKDKDQEKDPK